MVVSKRIDLPVQQSVLTDSVKNVVKMVAGEPLTAEPAVSRNHIKWNEKYRMNVRGKDKGYYEGALVSCVTLYQSEKHLARKLPCGSVVLYFDEEALRRFMQASGLPEEDQRNEAALLDFCGEFCNMVSGGFVNRVGNEGYQEILMEVPDAYREEIPDGIVFDRDNPEYLELVFTLAQKPVFTVDLLLSSIFTKV